MPDNDCPLCRVRRATDRLTDFTARAVLLPVISQVLSKGERDEIERRRRSVG